MANWQKFTIKMKILRGDLKALICTWTDKCDRLCKNPPC